MTADTCVTVSSGTRRKVDRVSLHGLDPVFGDGVGQHSIHGPGVGHPATPQGPRVDQAGRAGPRRRQERLRLAQAPIARQVLVPPTGPGCRPPPSKHGPAPGAPFRSDDGSAIRPGPVKSNQPLQLDDRRLGPDGPEGVPETISGEVTKQTLLDLH